MFVDATFSCVPVGFYQLLIVMVFDPALKIYIPVAYVLMSGKTEECYAQAFNWLCHEVKECAPYCVGVDFEYNFFRSVAEHFPETKLIGCLFHFKQAIRRKLIELNVPKQELEFAMRRGVIDLITVIPIEDLEQGVYYIRNMIMDYIHTLYIEDSDYESGEAAWNIFFDTYFQK